jgi:predicted adenylyl cyclase CyaB
MMAIKVETEKKYYCIEPEKLMKIAETMGFKMVFEDIETDEYFTDLNLEYIKNRTCLRIRKNSNSSLEITYKGKSTSLLSQYCKLENNINTDLEYYENYINLFASLGFYSYVVLKKNRMTLKKKNDLYEYSIMIDKLENIGGFVEFEIASLNEKSNREELSQLLKKFTEKFQSLKLKEANDPYRDITANYIYNLEVLSRKEKAMYINIDSELEVYEKDFFKKYKEKISKEFNSNIKWSEYKKNLNIDRNIGNLIDEYLEHIIFNDNQLLVTFILLERIKYKKVFISKLNENFYCKLLLKMGIKLEEFICIKDLSLTSYFKKNNIDITKFIIIDKKDVKSINNILLIICYMEGLL